jgi:hypothetical protein
MLLDGAEETSRDPLMHTDHLVVYPPHAPHRTGTEMLRTTEHTNED